MDTLVPNHYHKHLWIHVYLLKSTRHMCLIFDIYFICT